MFCKTEAPTIERTLKADIVKREGIAGVLNVVTAVTRFLLS